MAELDRNLAEYRVLGAGEVGLADAAREFMTGADQRRTTALAADKAPQLDALPALPPSPAATLRAEIARLSDEALALETHPPLDPARLARVVGCRALGPRDRSGSGSPRRACAAPTPAKLSSCSGCAQNFAIRNAPPRRARHDRLARPDHGRDSATRFGPHSVPIWRGDRTRAKLFDVALDVHRPAVKTRVLSEGEDRAGCSSYCLCDRHHQHRGGLAGWPVRPGA
jgi:hypothetical protein